MLKLRKNHLKDVRNELSEKQALIWDYFVPRKLIQMFYATNSEKRVFSDSLNQKFRDKEGIGKPIERIFIDIDRQRHSPDDSRKVALELINLIKNDNEFNKLVKIKKIVVLWTGASFHVYVLLKKQVDLKFYNRYLSYGSGKNKEESFIMKWAEEIAGKTGISASAGHEKSDKFIILDSSNTPSGKLARCPFSLHLKDWKTIDGVCVPVTVNELGDKNLVGKLQVLSPDSVLKDLGKYKKLL